MTALPPRPDLSRPLAPHVVEVPDAFVIPKSRGLRDTPTQHSGVLRADGSLVPESILWRGPDRVTLDPVPPRDGLEDRLKGRWLYMGVLFGHFGHFLMESVSRVWALPAWRGRIDGVVFHPKDNHRTEQLMEEYRPLLYALGIDVPVHLVTEPTRVDRLVVPPQGFGMFDMAEGAPEFRDYLRGPVAASVPPLGPEKLYISRTALNPKRGALVGEHELERRLVAEGYVPFHPQDHHHLVQIARYRAAKKIVCMDCTPLHLLALVGNASQTVGVIARREGDFAAMFERQIGRFLGARVGAIDVLVRNWSKPGKTRTDRNSWGEPDFAALGAALRDLGLIEAERWAPLSESHRRESLDRAEAANAHPMEPIRPAA